MTRDGLTDNTYAEFEVKREKLLSIIRTAHPDWTDVRSDWELDLWTANDRFAVVWDSDKREVYYIELPRGSIATKTAELFEIFELTYKQKEE